MADIASLGLSVTSKGVPEATADLTALVVAAEKAETAAAKLGDASTKAVRGVQAEGAAAAVAVAAALAAIHPIMDYQSFQVLNIIDHVRLCHPQVFPMQKHYVFGKRAVYPYCHRSQL